MMKFNKSRKFLLLIILCSVITTFGCAPENYELPTTFTETIQNSQPQEDVMSEIVTIFPTVTPTPTATITIHTMTPLPAPTLTPTLTPLPTLPPDEAIITVLDLVQNNAGCELPCYWGFTPGVTMWRDAIRFLNSIANPGSRIGNMTFTVPADISTSTFVRQSYSVNGEYIDMIGAQVGNGPTYSLSNFLKNYGVPQEIWIQTWYDGFEDDFSFAYDLFYPEKGILAIYTTGSQVTEDNVLGCPKNESNPILVLWSPRDEKIYFDLINNSPLLGNISEEVFPYIKKIEEISEMSPDTFFETYQDPNTTICFHMPRDQWPEIYSR